MYSYKLYFDGALIAEGNEEEFNAAAQRMHESLGSAPERIGSEDDMLAAVEGKMIGFFLENFVKDPLYVYMLHLAKDDFNMASGMIIASYLDYHHRFTTAITED